MDHTPGGAGQAAAIIVAAGLSARLAGPVPKPYRRVAGRTLLGHVLERFARARSVGEVVVVAAPEGLPRARGVAGRYAKVIDVVPGGELRQDSVRRGLERLSPASEVIVVHDAARPLAGPELIDDTVEAARRWGAAIAASPVVDTLKEVDGAWVARTVERSRLWRAETPQAVRRSWLRAGFRLLEAEGGEVTDEAMLVERLGRRVRIVPSRQPNFKVTYPADLELARVLLAREGRP